MKIAIWGFGPFGRSIYKAIAKYFCSDSVVMLFDKRPEGIDPSLIPDGMELRHPDDLAALYHDHCFDAVIVGIFDKKIRNSAISFLNERNIPVTNYGGLLDLFEIIPNREPDRGMKIFSKLQDEESRAWFKARGELAFGDIDGFYRAADKFMMGYSYHSYELDVPLRRSGAEQVILFGGGFTGMINRYVLASCGIPVKAYCVLDKSRAEECWPEISPDEIILPEDLCSPEYMNCLIVYSSREEQEAIRQRLAELEIPSEMLYEPPNYLTLTSNRQRQYFDVWDPQENEAFVDCGALDGMTSRDFHFWCKGNYDAIYAFEPLPWMKGVIEKNCGCCHDMKVFSSAVCDKNGHQDFCVFTDESASAMLSEREAQGSKIISVRTDRLDDVIRDRVSFIKMDIEGSEIAAINGAERLIRTCHPRLALSIYHKPFDFFDIPNRVLELVPEYRFWIRHYSTGLFETVLYAEV